MSSYHYVAESEWQARKEYITNTARYVANNQAEIDRIRAAMEKLESTLAARHAENMRAVTAGMNALRDAYSENARRAGQGVAHQVNAATGAFDERMNQMRQELRNTAGNLARLNTKTDELAQMYWEQFRLLAEREQGRKERGQLYMDELDRICRELLSANSERVKPGGLNPVELLRNMAADSIRSGNYAAAAISAQEGICAGSKLLTEVLLLNEYYNEELNEARLAAAKLRAKMDCMACEGTIEVPLNGESCKLEFDIRRWSMGAFDRLRTRLTAVETVLAKDDLSLDDLRRRQAELEQLKIDLADCERGARAEMVNSETTQDVAVRLFERLMTQGWRLVDSGFDQDDCSAPYKITMDNGFGTTISLVVSDGDFIMEAFADDTYAAEQAKRGVREVIEGESMQAVGMEADCARNEQDFQERTLRNMRARAQRRRDRLDAM